MRVRLDVLEQIQRTGKPVLMRTIWRGFEHFIWIYPLHRDGHAQGTTFLTLTRRAQSDAEAETLAYTSEYTWVDSKVATLGKLGVMSDRELEVLALLGQGLTIEVAASVLCRSPETIKTHRRAIGETLGVMDRMEYEGGS